MDKDYIKKRLDVLWDKVHEKPISSNLEHNDPRNLESAFEAAERQMQNESLNLLKSRLEKERQYWENLAAAKEETLYKLQLQIEEEQKRNRELKAKIDELQESQTQWLNHSFGTLELQKKSLNVRIEQLEYDLKESRQEAASLEYDLKNQKAEFTRMVQEWKDKETEWANQQDRNQAELTKMQEEFLRQRQTHLDEASVFESEMKELKAKLANVNSIHDEKRLGLENLIKEKDELIKKLAHSAETLQLQLDNFKDENRLAAVERERKSTMDDQNRKRMAEQVLESGKKIKELESIIESLKNEKSLNQEFIDKKKHELSAQESILTKRREDWVESIRSQTNQQLNISDKIVDLINRFESKAVPTPPASAQPLPTPTPPQTQYSQQSLSTTNSPSNQSPAKVEDSFWMRVPILKYLKLAYSEHKWISVSAAGLILFFVITFSYFFESEGRKSLKAQEHLLKGNELYTQGALPESIVFLEKAFKLDPQNSIIKNSYTLVLGEIAHKEYRDGQLELALRHTEILNVLIPEDPQVIQLHSNILRSMDLVGKKKEIIDLIQE